MSDAQHLPRRALAKATTWRILATAITAGCTWAVTGEVAFAASVGALDAFVKFGSYYLHERFWDRVDSGRTQASFVPVWRAKRRIGNALGDLRSRGREAACRRT